MVFFWGLQDSLKLMTFSNYFSWTCLWNAYVQGSPVLEKWNLASNIWNASVVGDSFCMKDLSNRCLCLEDNSWRDLSICRLLTLTVWGRIDDDDDDVCFMCALVPLSLRRKKPFVPQQTSLKFTTIIRGNRTFEAFAPSSIMNHMCMDRSVVAFHIQIFILAMSTKMLVITRLHFLLVQEPKFSCNYSGSVKQVYLCFNTKDELSINIAIPILLALLI
jgi:hypothetical protein